MSLQDLLKRSSLSGSTPAPVIPAPVVAAPVPATPVVATPVIVAPVDDRQKAPWHKEGCKACARSVVAGLSPSMRPCVVCANGKQEDVVKYNIIVNTDGSVIFKNNGIEIPVIPAPVVSVKESYSDSTQSSELKLEQMDVTPAEPKFELGAEQPTEPAKKRSRAKSTASQPVTEQPVTEQASEPVEQADPKLGYMLIVNSTIGKASAAYLGRVKYVEDVVREVIASLGQRFHEAGSFEQRDMVAAEVTKKADSGEFSGAILMALFTNGGTGSVYDIAVRALAQSVGCTICVKS